MIPTVFTTLALATNILSVAGQTLLATILAATSIWVPGSFMQTGNHILIPDASTTTTPGIYLNDETTPIKTYPISLGTEHCEGHTGALLCEVTVKLTGSGGKRTHNAGSWVCQTYSCAILSTEVHWGNTHVSDSLYAGWTMTPGAASGAQLLPNVLAASGAVAYGSGAYTSTRTSDQVTVPPGATVKAVWAKGNGTEDHSKTAAFWITTYRKYGTR